MWIMNKKRQREKINYKDVITSLEINTGETIFFTSNLTFLAYDAAISKEEFDENFILDTLIEKIGPKGTLILPVYNWDFCLGVPFDYKNTQSKTGHLGNQALKREDFKRTKNPIYSYAVWGKDKESKKDLATAQVISAAEKDLELKQIAQKTTRVLLYLQLIEICS